MPGVFRPYTVTDVLSTIVGNTDTVDTSDTTTGAFAEADEATTVAESFTTTVAANSTWDNGVWGAFTWS